MSIMLHALEMRSVLVVVVGGTFIGITNAIARLVLFALAFYAALHLLREPCADTRSEPACSHRLTVLYVLLAFLSRCQNSRSRPTLLGDENGHHGLRTRLSDLGGIVT